jgi:hypothetical protein
MKLRGSATDKLADVVQVLQLVHKTGLLQVQRSTVDNFVEQGSITFQDGQVIDAHVGQFRGSDAFKKLMTWTACHFIFENTPSITTPPITDLPTPDLSGRATGALEYGYTKGSSVTYTSVPYRLRQVQEVLSDFPRLGLSRMHRQLFLLIDGKRSAYELTSLIKRHPPEVLAMLADLERVGLISC